MAITGAGLFAAAVTLIVTRGNLIPDFNVLFYAAEGALLSGGSYAPR